MHVGMYCVCLMYVGMHVGIVCVVGIVKGWVNLFTNNYYYFLDKPAICLFILTCIRLIFWAVSTTAESHA